MNHKRVCNKIETIGKNINWALTLVLYIGRIGYNKKKKLSSKYT